MYKLIAFDAYGTLFDVYSVSALAEELFPGHGEVLSALWRDRQIEYTRLVTMSDHGPSGSRHYLPFDDITVRALRYTCKRLGLALRADTEARLMEQYAHLDPFPDSRRVLEALKPGGFQTAILSNGNPEMLARLTTNTGLATLLDQIVSVDPVRLFKTAPEAYGLLLEAFAVERQEILFVSSNAWDALGATWFGFDVYWVNRAGHPFEEIGRAPRYQGSSLTELLPILQLHARSEELR